MTIITLGINLLNVDTSRASIIPYVVIDGSIFFLLGRDQKSGDITDLGGGVKRFESTLDAAFREFNEESDDVFKDYLRPNDNWRSPAIFNEYMGVLFIPLTIEWFHKATSIFEEHKKSKTPRKKSHSEIRYLKWLKEDEFIELISSQTSKDRMWSRIRSFYRKGYNRSLRQALYLAYPY